MGPQGESRRETETADAWRTNRNGPEPSSRRTLHVRLLRGGVEGERHVGTEHPLVRLTLGAEEPLDHGDAVGRDVIVDEPEDPALAEADVEAPTTASLCRREGAERRPRPRPCRPRRGANRGPCRAPRCLNRADCWRRSRWSWLGPRHVDTRNFRLRLALSGKHRVSSAAFDIGDADADRAVRVERGGLGRREHRAHQAAGGGDDRRRAVGPRRPIGRGLHLDARPRRQIHGDAAGQTWDVDLLGESLTHVAASSASRLGTRSMV